MNEKIYDAYWEGPFKWKDREKHVKSGHVLYSLHGTHPPYGRDVLLYIGMTEGGLPERLASQGSWIPDEFDDVAVKVASVGPFKDWETWNHFNHGETYPKAPGDIVRAVEALLIHAHYPAYNTAGKGSFDAAEGYRVFNTGKSGALIPELSYLYYHGYE